MQRFNFHPDVSLLDSGYQLSIVETQVYPSPYAVAAFSLDINEGKIALLNRYLAELLEQDQHQITSAWGNFTRAAGFPFFGAIVRNPMTGLVEPINYNSTNVILEINDKKVTINPRSPLQNQQLNVHKVAFVKQAGRNFDRKEVLTIKTGRNSNTSKGRGQETLNTLLAETMPTPAVKPTAYDNGAATLLAVLAEVEASDQNQASIDDDSGNRRQPAPRLQRQAQQRNRGGRRGLPNWVKKAGVLGAFLVTLGAGYNFLPEVIKDKITSEECVPTDDLVIRTLGKDGKLVRFTSEGVLTPRMRVEIPRLSIGRKTQDEIIFAPINGVQVANPMSPESKALDEIFQHIYNSGNPAYVGVTTADGLQVFCGK